MKVLRALALTVSVGALGWLFIWSYWPTCLRMAERWVHDPQYSHGFLVPIFAAIILWHRRGRIPHECSANWWGLGLLVVGLGMRLVGAFGDIDFLDACSLLPALAGVTLLVGGIQALSWAWPAIAFLGFMVPLPFFLETALAQPLRRVATVCSTYALQTLGYPALSEGNVIIIDESKLGIIDACNGLGMLMTFFALATAVALLLDGRGPERLIVVASAIPIAVIANVVRITSTALVQNEWGVQAGKDWHDWAGWLMMPLALGLLWLEWRYLRALLTDPAPTNPLPMELGGLKTFVPSTPRADVSTPNGVCQPTAAGKDDHVDIKNPTV